MPKFDPGQVVATSSALSALPSSGQTPTEFLRKHVNGDWGHLDGHDEEQNPIALREGGRLVSAYQTRKGDDLWVITEADRTATTRLFASGNGSCPT